LVDLAQGRGAFDSLIESRTTRNGAVHAIETSGHSESLSTAVYSSQFFFLAWVAALVAAFTMMSRAAGAAMLDAMPPFKTELKPTVLSLARRAVVALQQLCLPPVG
jgi:hypothetical protein